MYVAPLPLIALPVSLNLNPLDKKSLADEWAASASSALFKLAYKTFPTWLSTSLLLSKIFQLLK